MRKITLFGLKQLALIICVKSGVIYHNQVSGFVCTQKEAEGVLAIFDECDEDVLLSKLIELTLNKQCLTIDDAEKINSLIRQHFNNDTFLSVDLDNLSNSSEAWIHVNIEGDYNKINNEWYQLHGFAGEKGILTWENSD